MRGGRLMITDLSHRRLTETAYKSIRNPHLFPANLAAFVLFFQPAH